VASLYRRHRPRTFADVVGQEHVVRTLSNAVQQDRVHHAYLFVGSRGTGKTSMAKILAASLNCQGEAGGGSGPGGPTVAPCGACESCVSIASATSLDVVEMDAASNNSVDDIRDLRERVGYAPVGGRHKVYILDEAHMLTTAAWNAFLKTLEEPPPHTIFVLATTEANKVLPTVVDRCHRFDFARPGVAQIAAVLRRVADSESIEIPDEAVALVARAATGSFRDALGTLEQLVAYSGSSVALDDVLAVLGAADADLLFGAVDAVASGDAASALRACARLADSGRDLGRFFGDLEAHARGLMVTQVLGGVPPELSVTPEQDERLAEQAGRVGVADVVRLLELLAAGLRAMKDGADARTQLELALVKAAAPDRDAGTTALLARIERLEARLAGGPTVPPPAGPTAPPRAPSEPATAAGRAGRTQVAVATQVDDGPPVATSATVAGTPAGGAEGARALVEHAAAQASADAATEADPAPVTTAVAVVEPGAPAPEPTFSAAIGLSLESFNEVWPAVLERLASESPMLAGALREARPAELADQGLTIAWPQASAFTKRQADDPAKKEMLVQAIRAVTGASLRLAHEVRADHDVSGSPAAAAAAPALSDDQLVERFMAEFDAEELPPEQPEPPSQES
jgi:DNA polymerase-3 subunit gamma/tau